MEDDDGAEVPPSDAPSGGEPVPLLRRPGRPVPGGSALAYLCRNMVCERPVATPEDLRTRLLLMAGQGPVS